MRGAEVHAAAARSARGPVAVGRHRGRLADYVAQCPPAMRAEAIWSAIESGGRLVLAGADLRGIDLATGPTTGLPAAAGALRAGLSGADLRGAQLAGARLGGVDLRGAALDGAILAGADLSGADLRRAGLQGANLTGADLRGADLSGVDARGASLLAADLTAAVLRGADLRDALLHSANLTRADLRAADLRWAQATRARFGRADLRGALCEGASLRRADLTGATLSAGTRLGLAFLHAAALEADGLCRQALEGGVGEQYTSLAAARDVYLHVEDVLARRGRDADAAWAHRMASRADTASHRPDRAPAYYPLPRAVGSPTSAARAPLRRAGLRRLVPAIGTPFARCRHAGRVGAYYVGHTARWLWGTALDLLCGLETRAGRLATAAVLVWLAGGAASHGIGAPSPHGDHPARPAGSQGSTAAVLTALGAPGGDAAGGGGRAIAAAETAAVLFLLAAAGRGAHRRSRRRPMIPPRSRADAAAAEAHESARRAWSAGFGSGPWWSGGA